MYSPCCRAYLEGDRDTTESPHSNCFLGERMFLADGETVPYGHLRRGDVSVSALLGAKVFSSRTGEKCNARTRLGLITGQLRGVQQSILTMFFWGVFRTVKVDTVCTLEQFFWGDRGILSGLDKIFWGDKMVFSAARLLNGEQPSQSEKTK